MPSADPKTVVQAHRLRAAATRAALLHGRRAARTERASIMSLLLSFGLGGLILVTVIVVHRVLTLLHHTGH
jgi:hypothetical protein